MSGGIAYVYDKNKVFQDKCNFAMIETQELNHNDISSLSKLFNKYTFLENDQIRIKEMLKRHSNYTNSPKSNFILNNFDEEIKNFVKVVPTDFKKAIENRNLENRKSGKENLWEK